MSSNQPFPLGQCVANVTAVAALERLGLTPLHLIARHVHHDWGDLDASDKRLNDEALASGERILSRYDYGEVSFYVVTEWDRSYTTVMLVEDY
jgi:hypothetical protein